MIHSLHLFQCLAMRALADVSASHCECIPPVMTHYIMPVITFHENAFGDNCVTGWPFWGCSTVSDPVLSPSISLQCNDTVYDLIISDYSGPLCIKWKEKRRKW